MFRNLIFLGSNNHYFYINSILTSFGIVLAPTCKLNAAAINNATNVINLWGNLTGFAIFDILSTPTVDSQKDRCTPAY